MPLGSLVTLTELKQYIAINETNTSFDISLRQLARVATKSLETFCRVQFSEQQYIEIFDTRKTGGYSYDLSSNWENDSGYIADPAIQSFALKGQPVNTDLPMVINFDVNRAWPDENILLETDYFFNAGTKRLYIYRALPEASKALKITYTGGFPTDANGNIEAPEDLKLACITQVIFMFNKMQEGNIGVRGTKKFSPEYVQNEQMLCPEALAMSAPYRRQLVGKR